MPLIPSARPPVPWRPLPTMQEYLDELAATDKSKDYVRMVRVGLSYFAEFLAGEGIAYPGDITRDHILRFKVYLSALSKPDGQPYRETYRSKIMAYVKGWCTWARNLEYMTQKDPWLGIVLKKPKKKPKPIASDDIATLFDGHKRGAFRLAPFDFHQREVILVLLYSWGLRVHELASINVAHVDMRLNGVTVRNKGGGTKILPYGDLEKTVISRWLRHRAKYASFAEDALLVSRSGKRITTQRIWEVVTDLGKQVGVQVNPHRFRDTLGTTMMSSNVSVEIVMQLLGWTNRAQAMEYSQIVDQAVETAHETVLGDHLRSLMGFKGEPAVEQKR